MKTFEINMGVGTSALSIRIQGEIICVNENTGQSIIYSKNDPTYVNIVAVIPAMAVVTLRTLNN